MQILFGNVGNIVTFTTDGSTVTFLKTLPTVTISGPEETIPGETATYTLVFNGASEISITPEDITINRTGDVTGGTADITGTGDTRAVSITGLSGYGNISIKVAADVIFDIPGNGNVETEFSNEAAIDYGIGTLTIEITGNSSSWTNQNIILMATVTNSRGRSKRSEICRRPARCWIF